LFLSTEKAITDSNSVNSSGIEPVKNINEDNLLAVT
jgi:hypothetical protein